MFVEAIDALTRETTPRAYLGASSIGHPCSALLALSLRGMPDDPPPNERTNRIFDLGHWIEAEVVEALRRAGFAVEPIDPATGGQWAFKLFAGHVRGHADGKIEHDGTWLLEIKSMKAAKWRAFVRHGVAKSHPQYFSQVQMLMEMSGWRKCVIIAYNKDTSELFEEHITYDPIEGADLRRIALDILRNQVNPLRENRDHWMCRGCFKKSACLGVIKVEPSCRRCQFSVPADDGEWYCKKHEWAAIEPCDDFTVWRPGFDPFGDD